MSDTRQHLHELIDRLPPTQLTAVAGLLEFDETLTWLEHQVAQRWMAEEGIAVLVGLAPELFGHQLLFWELIVRTAPH